MESVVVSAALKKVAESFIAELFPTIAKKAMGKLQSEFGVGFRTYMQRNQDKCRLVKTLLHRINPIPIESAYVEPSLNVQERVVAGSAFPQTLDELRKIVVIGNGGSGKSMFLKKLFLELCEYPLGRIPIFVELRDLNSRDDKDIFKLVYYHWSELIPSFNVEALESGFRSGKFFLLLDGFDEVDRQERTSVARSIHNLSYKFTSCPIVLTSRPLNDLSYLPEFYGAEIRPFDLPKIIELVDRMSVDADAKAGFLSEVRGRLIASHLTFLSNPLLCTMMVLTYSEFESIPSKMYIFYARAFDVLFARHDKTKPLFNRKFYTTLAEDDFKRLFSTFCLFSYLDGVVSFDARTAVNLLEKVFEFEGVTVNPRDFLSDLHESISILVKDGDTSSFLHRSFQEHFVAVFLAERQLPMMDELFEKILSNSSGENVLGLLFEMNRDALESKFLIQKVRELRDDLAKLNPNRDLPRILSMMVSDLTVSDGRRVTWDPGDKYQLLSLLCGLYNFNHWNGTSNQMWDILASASWIDDVSRDGEDVHIDILVVRNSLIQTSSTADTIVGLRSEVIELDKSFRKKEKNKGSFVRELMKRKS